MPFDPTKAAQKWGTNYAASGDKFQAGVNAVSQNPAAAAATDAAMNKARTNYAAAMAAGGKFANSMSKVTIDSWKQATINGFNAKAGAAASAAQPKVVRFLTNLAQAQAAYLPGLKAMPRNNPADMDARMMKNVNSMRALRGKLK